MGLLDFLFGSMKKEQEQQHIEDGRRQHLSHQIERINTLAAMANQETSTVFLAVFSASWCGPSKRFIKEINEAGVTNYAYIDVDKEEELSIRFSIMSVPTTLLIDEKDNVIKKWVGYDDEDPGQSKFVQFIKSYPKKIVPYKNISNHIVNQNQHTTPSKNNSHTSTNMKFIEDHRTTFYELEDIKYRSMGGDLMLAPYDFNFYLKAPDAKILPTLTNTDRIHRFLPGLGFDDEEYAKNHLKGYILQTENQLGVAYFIRLKNIPIGLVHVDTPLYNKKVIGKAIWTIDFFIAEQFENQGIMYNAVVRVLNEMKNAMNAKVVYALVDQDNNDCISFLGKGLFKRVSSDGFKNNNGGLPPFVYMIDIEHMQFLKQ